MAQDRIEKIKLSIGKKAAAFSRAAALRLEIHRLRLEARTLRAEARQTEKEMRKELSEVSEKSYEAWKEKADWKTLMEEAFQAAGELEGSANLQREEAARLEETAEELKSLRRAEKETAAASEAENREEGDKDREPGDPEARLEAETAPDADGNPEAEEKADTEAVCVCPSCGASYRKIVNYCRLCGTALEKEREKNQGEESREKE